jgi:hypothetical protein
MVWKEWREFRDQSLSLRRGGLSALILALILGVVAPVQLGPEWVHSKIIVGYWPFLAATMVSSLIADSVAGERERHTLETLLASRLPDAAILIGKIVAAVLYGLGFAVAEHADRARRGERRTPRKRSDPLRCAAVRGHDHPDGTRITAHGGDRRVHLASRVHGEAGAADVRHRDHRAHDGSPAAFQCARAGYTYPSGDADDGAR